MKIIFFTELNLENLLKNEKSPYLKQHKSNPVYWYPWGEKALEQSKKLKKPIFLSVGYASCHWCHVMAHESFEDKNTATVMNEKFINIKVDREERPDLDNVFQKSLAILAGVPGGWPLSMFLDENGVPFSGGTYFPPQEMQGRPSFINVLNQVSDFYEKNKDKIIQQASQLKNVFQKDQKKSSVISQNLDPHLGAMLHYVDFEWGGFKGSPKFPQFYVFESFLHFYKKNKNKKYYDAVKILFNNVCSKGLYDHLLGGVARYSTDDRWIAPHFEKMLYDNILFVNLLGQFYLQEPDEYYKDKIIQTVEFINQSFKNKDNLLGSAYDADSEGVEGKYYVWDDKELRSVLESDYDLFAKYYDISENGNWKGKNILIEKSIKPEKKEVEKLKKIKNKLLNIREKRQKPFFDDKTQIDLNAYWTSTLLFVAEVFDKDEWKKIALQNYNTIKNLTKDEVYHCYKDKEGVKVFLDDYTYLVQLMINFYEITGEITYLNSAKDMAQKTWDLFYDKNNKILQKNPIEKNDLFVPPSDINDSNIPNGNSIFLLNCKKIEVITGETKWQNMTKELIQSFHAFLNLQSTQMVSYIKNLDMCEELQTFSFFGDINKNKVLHQYVKKNYFRSSTLIYKHDSKENYLIVCKNQTCSNKIKTIEELKSVVKNYAI
ncbi:MAG TPA: thioredoxin domain-containing protein [Candidatus Pelagibacter sp.]|nr:thioredoxin domain-containing protein [Candidatus Pelagibacter sp.]